jgi:hypothetical protein
MTVKQLVFQDQAREKIRRGVDALADAVKVTLGPRGRTVILDRDFGPPQTPAVEGVSMGQASSTRTTLRRSEFAMTLTDDNAMAAAATTGESSKPNKG